MPNRLVWPTTVDGTTYSDRAGLTTVAPVTAPHHVLQHGIQKAVADGWRVEATGPDYAVLVRGAPISAARHLINITLTLCTCGLWAPVYLLILWLAGERRAVLTVSGNTVTLQRQSRTRN